MSFKKIDIYGFKSFADKTEIQFEPGFTGIVGPNGCGKSNVVDAVRWVLGEQSPKVLRGGKMQDVIFTGTDTRKSMSYCEVALHFDNTNRTFAYDADNLVISRKLYRSGDSEYAINHTPCRLKDITDLLHDTGIGKEGYCIIGQGKIDALLSAKPEDRRGIFEEAAGVAKFKSRRHETQLKLEHVEDNLVRFKDIISELERQRGPLETQAKEAKIAMELGEELKTNEVNTYIYRVENANESRKAIQDKLDAIGEDIRQRQDEFNTAQYMFNKASSDIVEADTTLNDLKDNKTNLLVEAEKISGLNIRIADRIEHLKAERTRLNQELLKAQSLITVKSEELENTLRGKDERDKTIQSLNTEISELEHKYTLIYDEISDYEQQINDNNTRMFSTMDELGDIKANMSKLLAEQDALTGRYGENEDRIRKRNTDISALTEDLDQNVSYLKQCEDKAQDIKSKVDNTASQVKELSDDVTKYTEEVRALDGRITALTTKINMLEDMRRQYAGFQNAVKYLMQATAKDDALASHIEGVVAEVISVEDKYKVAIENALGASLQHVIIPDDDSAKYVVNYINNNRIGRVTLLPMTTMQPRHLDKEYSSALTERGVLGIASDFVKYDSKYDRVILAQLGNTVLVDNMDTAKYVSRKYNMGFKVVTLTGEVYATTGSITGGGNKNEGISLLGKEDEINALNDALVKTQKDHSALAITLRDSKRKYDEMSNLLSGLKEQQHSAEIELALEQEKANKIKGDVATLTADRDTILAQNEEILKKISIIEGQVKSVDRLEGDINEQRSEVNRLVELHKSEFEQKKAERERISQELTSKRVSYRALESEAQSGNANATRLKRECEDATISIRDMQLLLSQVEMQMKDAEKEALDNAMSDDNKQKIETIEQEISALETKKKQLLETQSAMDSKKNTAMELIQKVVEKKAQEEAKLEKLDTDLIELQDHIAESYQLTYESALKYRVEDFKYDEAQATISRIRRKIQSMGLINMRAIDDFRELEDRYTEQVAQRDDMIKAKADLEKIISELTIQMTDKFATEFKKIQENFSVVFKELFGGGRGELILEENPEDEMEAGIEILASPVGKTNLKNISLLSGGERALTAIAILFAIIKLKPMPFCILDEIEAALDDSNARLFASYLRKFADNTQFIVITHRKPTMELADSLYGVTMEEAGVSKLVSVKLSDAIKVAEVNR